MVPDCPPGFPGEDAAPPQRGCSGTSASLPSAYWTTPRDRLQMALKHSTFLTLGRKLRRCRDPKGTDRTQLSVCLLLLTLLHSLFSPPLKPLHLIYKYILLTMCSPNSYSHKHNINIPNAENRDYNIIKYISFSFPISAEVMNEIKQKPNQATPRPHENKMLFGPKNK